MTVGRRSGGRLLYLTYTFVRVPSEHVYGGEKRGVGGGGKPGPFETARVPNVPKPPVLKSRSSCIAIRARQIRTQPRLLWQFSRLKKKGKIILHLIVQYIFKCILI